MVAKTLHEGKSEGGKTRVKIKQMFVSPQVHRKTEIRTRDKPFMRPDVSSGLDTSPRMCQDGLQTILAQLETLPLRKGGWRSRM